MTPKEYKQMMDYLTRSGVRKQIKFASDIARPDPKPEIKEIEAINEFVRRNPRADGGRIGFRLGEKVQLTREKIESMAAKDDGMRAADILKELKKDKTKRYVTATGTPINRSMIQRVLTGAGDRNLQIQDQIPEGYISSTELFKKLPISKKDYYRNVYKPGYAGKKGTLFTRKIDELLQPIKIPGVQTQYFKNPTKEQLKLFEKYSSRKGILAERTAKLMKNFHDAFSNKYAKGELPTIKEIKELFPDVTPTTAGNVTAKLGQWYKGTKFLNPELESINVNKDLGKKIQKAMSVSRFGRFYPDQAYQTALNTIDEAIGREVGTFKSFKDAASKALKEAGLPIYSKKSPFGFNLNEMAGVTGASRTKTAAFSDFVDIAEGNFNQKQLGAFQKEFAAIREQLDELDLANNVQNRGKAQSLINNFQDRIKYYEEATGSELPRLGLGTADRYYSAERLMDIAKERNIGEKRSRNQMFKRIPGTDLLGASKSSGYTVIVPENYRTFGQILETGKRGELKKNVQNTLEGMKKFFNEYDEKKMFQKLKDASPDTLRKMMRVIPKVVSLEDDFLNAYGFPLTAGLDSSIGVRPVEEEKNFIQRNPFTTAAGTAAAAATTKTGRNILKRLATGAFTPTGVALQTAGLGGLDLTTPAGRLSLGAEAAFAPELVKASIGATRGMKNRALQKGIQQALNLGLPTRLALRAARIASPIGIATLAGEGLYQAGKFSRDRIRELQSMTPEQRQQLRAEQSALAFEGARDGGLIGKKSGPPPESGPMSQGLPGLLKRVKKL